MIVAQYQANPVEVKPWMILAGIAGIGTVVFLATRDTAPVSAKKTVPGVKIPPQPPPTGPGPGPTEPAPIPGPTGSGEQPDPANVVDWNTVSFAEMDLSGYPWERPLLISSPTPGMIYRVVGGNNMSWLVRNAVGAALVMANRSNLVPYMNPNYGDYGAEWAARLRRQMRDAMVCQWFNDTLYGQEDESKAGGSFGMGPNGRGLNFLPRHANNIGRLAAGLPARRTTTINGNRQSGIPVNESDSHMAVYVPAPNLQAMKDVPPDELNFVWDLKWSNGTSTLNPPPQITQAGIVDYLFEGGCNGWEQ